MVKYTFFTEQLCETKNPINFNWTYTEVRSHIPNLK